jgi:hypothetical protein
MEHDNYYNLRELLSQKIEINQLDDGNLFVNEIPLNDYESELELRCSHFIGECNRNIENYKESIPFVHRELYNYRLKISHNFNREFHIDFNDPHKKLDFELFKISEKEFPTAFTEAIEIKFDTYLFILSFLDKTINNLIPPYRSSTNKIHRKKALPQNFYLNLTDEQFIKLYQELMAGGMLNEETSPDIFIDIFSGRKIENKVIWRDDIYSLVLFVRSINKKKCFGKYLWGGVWEIVADRFKPKDKDYYTPNQLIKASKTKNKDYTYVENIASYVYDLVYNNEYEY